MKTRFFKFVLPVFALMLAVSFAFATKSQLAAKIAYYEHPVLGWQSTMVGDECGQPGIVSCTFNGLQLYSQPSTSSILLRKF